MALIDNLPVLIQNVTNQYLQETKATLDDAAEALAKAALLDLENAASTGALATSTQVLVKLAQQRDLYATYCTNLAEVIKITVLSALDELEITSTEASSIAEMLALKHSKQFEQLILRTAVERSSKLIRYYNTTTTSLREFVDFKALTQKYLTSRASMSSFLSRLSLVTYENSFRQASETIELISESAGIKRYKYVGPVDGKIRAFCASVVGKSFTRAEIDAFGSHSWRGKSSTNIFVSRGGYNCRHIWIPLKNDV